MVVAIAATPSPGGFDDSRPRQTSDRAFCRQHPAARRRNRIPHARRGGGATSLAAARRRDRHPQDLDPLFARCAGREPGDRGRFGRAALQIHPVGRQAAARNPAASAAPRSQARPRHLRHRLCRHGDCLLGRFRAPAESRGDPARGQVPGVAADPDRAHLQQHGALRPAGALARADRASRWRGRADRRRGPQRPARGAMGRVPGSAGLGGLL